MSKFSNADRRMKNLSEKDLFSFANQNLEDAEATPTIPTGARPSGPSCTVKSRSHC